MPLQLPKSVREHQTVEYASRWRIPAPCAKFAEFPWNIFVEHASPSITERGATAYLAPLPYLATYSWRKCSDQLEIICAETSAPKNQEPDEPRPLLTPAENLWNRSAGVFTLPRVPSPSTSPIHSGRVEILGN